MVMHELIINESCECTKESRLRRARIGLTGLTIVALLLYCLTPKLAYAILAGDEPLAEGAYDPTASLAQVQFRDIYTPAQYGTNAQQNVLQIRPIVNISPFWLIPCEQLLRPTFRVVTAARSKSASTSTGYDDMQLLDLFIMRWPNTDAIKLRWALGFFHFPDRHQSATRTGRVATRTRRCLLISRHPRSGYSRTTSAGNVIRVYLVAFQAGDIADFSADPHVSAGRRMVSEVE